MEDILKAVASGLKLDAAKFLADFKNGDDWKTESEIAEQLGDFISEKVKAANETARKTGRSESSAKVARLIKNSGFENPDGLQGDELLKSFLEWKDEQSQHVEGDPSKLSKEELLKLPAVKSIVQEVTAKAGDRFSQEKKALEEKLQVAENTRKGILIEKQMLSYLEKAKVNLGDTPEQRSLRLELLKTRIPLSQIEVGENDAVKFLGSDGYEADFEKVVTDIAVPAFGVVTQDKNKGGSGAQGSGAGANGAGGTKVTIAAGTSQRDFDAMIMSAKPEERPALMMAWNEQQNKAAG